jgi:hypothetical protein
MLKKDLYGLKQAPRAWYGFNMLECKAMNTPMETKLKLLVDTSAKHASCSIFYDEDEDQYEIY